MATKISATEDSLGLIHQMTTEYIMSRLEEAKTTGVPLPPAELSAITKFLKDNGIECTKADMENQFEAVLLDAPEYDEIEANYG